MAARKVERLQPWANAVGKVLVEAVEVACMAAVVDMKVAIFAAETVAEQQLGVNNTAQGAGSSRMGDE